MQSAKQPAVMVSRALEVLRLILGKYLASALLLLSNAVASRTENNP
jgi:hypothetical protein